MYRIIAVMTLAFALSGCVAGYTLVKPETVSVAGGSMKVKPAVAWNKVPRSGLNIQKEESWTQNGVMLDSITFMGGLEDGEAIAKQRPKDDRKVPVFRSNMTPQDLVSMIESSTGSADRSACSRPRASSPRRSWGSKASSSISASSVTMM